MTQQKDSVQPDKVSDDVETTQETQTQTASEDKVAYDTYRRVLSEKKKLQEKYEALEKEQKAKKEKEMQEQNQYKEMFEARNKELDEYKNKYETLQNQFVIGRKYKAFFSQLNANIDEKYWDKIDDSKIVLDPETNEPDMFSVKKYVEEFTKTYPEIIRPASSAKVPNNAPQKSGPLSYEEWLKLPTAEMKKRQHEVQTN
jgi:hypothetical protein